MAEYKNKKTKEIQITVDGSELDKRMSESDDWTEATEKQVETAQAKAATATDEQ